MFVTVRLQLVVLLLDVLQVTDLTLKLLSLDDHVLLGLLHLLLRFGVARLEHCCHLVEVFDDLLLLVPLQLQGLSELVVVFLHVKQLVLELNVLGIDRFLVALSQSLILHLQ